MIEQGKPTNAQEFRCGISTANNLDKATIHLAFSLGIGGNVEIARKAGLDGIEVWTTRPINAFQSATGFITDKTKEGILSTHQSSRTQTVFDAFSSRSPKLIAQALLLPDINDSLAQMERLHDYVGRDIPAVIYKETPVEFHEQTHIKRRIIQPDPEVCQKWDVKSARDFVHKMRKHGFTGICLDLTHIRRGGQDGSSPAVLANWKKSISIFLEEGVIDEVHASSGRTDPETAKAFGREKTLAELKDLYDGTTKTDATQMLHYLANKGWRGQIIFEVLPSAMLEITNSRNRFMTQKDLVAVYTTLRERIYTIFNN